MSNDGASTADGTYRYKEKSMRNSFMRKYILSVHMTLSSMPRELGRTIRLQKDTEETQLHILSERSPPKMSYFVYISQGSLENKHPVWYMCKHLL